MAALLGIDAGTTAMKAVIFDLQGNPLGSSLHEYQLNTPAPDIVELETETYWRTCCLAIREALARSDLPATEIEALGISSQGETLICLDAAGKPLRPAIVWLDNRATVEAAAIEAKFGAEQVFRVTGQPGIVPTWPACKILWIREHQPRLFEKTARFLLLEDYLLYRLTGRFVAEKGLHTSSLMLDIEHKDWWPEMFHFLGIDTDRVGELMEPGQVVGNLGPEGAAATGLDPHTLAVSGSMDQTAGAVAAGNTLPGLVSEATGGALAICATLSGLVLDPDRHIPTHYHAIPNQYCLLPFGQTGGMALRWFRDAFCGCERTVAFELGVNSYQVLVEEADRVAPGSDGVVFLPHLMGAASPEFDPTARGVFYGISLQHGRSHFIRAILESVAYMLKKNLDIVEEIAGPVLDVRAMGGGARSRSWLQIKADVLQKTVTPLAEEEAGALGVAMLAGVAAGLFSNPEEATACMARLGQPVHPDPAWAGAYATGYQTYLELYQSLSPLFERSQARQAG